MTLSIGSTAPDFTAETTQGTINFHDWMGESWTILFSHPKAFTPVCTTELGYMAGLGEEFAKRNTKILGLSVDSSEDNRDWLPDIEEVSGNKVDYPVVGDSDLKVAKLYNMLPADETGNSQKVRVWQRLLTGKRAMMSSSRRPCRTKMPKPNILLAGIRRSPIYA